MQVTIITQRHARDLELKINDWLETHSSSDVIDIKYSIGGSTALYGASESSAMIIYK